jgi:hypothetical protein
MSVYHNLPILKICFVAVALPYTSPANGQQFSKISRVNFLNTTNSIVSAHADTGATKETSSLAYLTLPAAYEPAVAAIPKISVNTPQERKELLGYLKQATSDDAVSYNQSRKNFLYGLANVFTKLRLYPLAMKCFLKTTAARPANITDTLQADNTGYLPILAADDSLVAKQALLANAPNFNNKKSKVTNYKYITSTLNDGKKAVAYAMLFHVKQPVPGKRKIFVWGNTGHTFITLIKYNVDSTYSSFSFGFYPKKRNPLSATPAVPTASSVFKDDTDHSWDEVAGKFISKKKFEKILQLTKQYDKLEYHLSNNNCTDFGLKAAQLAGINIDGTTGSWPLGHGNNPAITGQSMLEGKVSNADTGKVDGVFVNNTVVVP